MKFRFFMLLLGGFFCLPVQAAETGRALSEVSLNLQDRASLQRGARLFRNYCLSCHSAAYMRYNRMAKDLDIPEKVLQANFLFGDEKPGDTMQVAMSRDSAERYFGGAVPPDLSVIARSRGADWLYSYLKGFYLDTTRPFGMNNLVLPGVNMPHVLWELQGLQKAVYSKKKDGGLKISRLELETRGRQSPEEYDDTVRDLVNFMVYLGEPVKLKRYRIGLWVMVYLFVFLLIAWVLKREYWRDVH